MFLFKSNKRDSEAMSELSSARENHTHIQRRLYIAENTPEPVFDLSHCSLNKLPEGILAKCRVFRKTALILNNNLLSSLPDLGDLSLLTVLNVASNQLNKLPDSIGCLVNLEIFDAHSNQLTTLPGSLSKLKSLRKLDISDNNLTCLPPGVRSIGCEIKFDRCPLVELTEPKSAATDASYGTADCSSLAENVEPNFASVWERRQRMLKQLCDEMAQVEQRLVDVTMNEYEKRDKQQTKNVLRMSEERVELAASFNNLLLKKEIELSEFRSAGIQMHFEDSTTTGDRDCVVCLENALQLVALLPCGHICVCRNCAEKLTTCPLCREEVSVGRRAR